MFTLKFWKQALERALKTAGQTGAVFFGAEQINVLNFDWLTLAGLMSGGFVLSVFTSIASLPIGKSPSLLKD